MSEQAGFTVPPNADGHFGDEISCRQG